MNHNELQQIHDAIERCHDARREAQRLLVPFLAPRLRHAIDAVIEPQDRATLLPRAMTKIIDEFGYFVPEKDWYQRLVRQIGREVQRHLGPATPSETDEAPHQSAQPGMQGAPPPPRPVPDIEDIGFTKTAAQQAMDALDLTRLGKLSSREAMTLLLAKGGVKQHDIAKARGLAPSTISRELTRAHEAYQDLADGVP